MDGTERAPVPNACVVAEAGRIVGAGPLGRVKVPPGVRILTAPRGSTLLPGFIDMHVHCSVMPGMMPYFLANGVTSVRDLGCAEDRLEELKTYRADAPPGRQLGPRLFLSGPPLDGFPRAATWFPGPGARNEDEAAAAVRDLAGRGVDVIKLYRRLPLPAARAAIAEARRLRLPVTWDYQWNYRYLQAAAGSGVDGLEHVFYSARASQPELVQVAELMGAQRLWLDPTLVAFRPPDAGVTRDPDFEQVPPALTRFWRGLFWPMETDSEFAEMKSFVRRSVRYGARILVGTDCPVKWVAPGYAFHRELQLLTECGLTPAQALQAATRSAAQALRREKELGTVEPGKLADLVVVTGDPLNDIRAASKVRWVVLNGRLHEPARLVAEGRKAAPTSPPRLPPHADGD